MAGSEGTRPPVRQQVDADRDGYAVGGDLHQYLGGAGRVLFQFNFFFGNPARAARPMSAAFRRPFRRVSGRPVAQPPERSVVEPPPLGADPVWPAHDADGPSARRPGPWLGEPGSSHGTVKVTVEWALHGKEPEDAEGYRVLGQSDGVISRGLFESALARFSPGMLEKLPQVTMSWLSLGQSDGRYVALAIHEKADGKMDRLGRGVILTRYFCMPFASFPDARVSYEAMYEAVRGIALPTDNGLPVPIDMAIPGPSAYSAGEQESWVAELLLTRKPVCILGAREVSILDRLRFIDAVTSMLPFGMRSQMSASTWTSTTAMHKFRLYFSDAPRHEPVLDHSDHTVSWGRPAAPADHLGLTAEPAGDIAENPDEAPRFLLRRFFYPSPLTVIGAALWIFASLPSYVPQIIIAVSVTPMVIAIVLYLMLTPRQRHRLHQLSRQLR